MFELKTITECELTTFVGRTQREGKDDIPAVSFPLALSGVSNTMLDMFSKTLREAIYCTVEATGAEIDGSTGHPGAAAGQGSLMDEEAQTPEGALAASLAGDGDSDGYDEEEDEGAAPDLETRLDAALDQADAGEFEAGATQAISKARGSRRAAKAH